jgi:hypothetical protein
MKRTIVVAMLVLATALAGHAQSKSKHKPSAAVHKTSQTSAGTNSSAITKPNATATAKSAATDASATAAPAEDNLPSSGPLYPDEKGPLPTPAPKTAAKTIGFTPSDLPAGTAIRMKLQSSLSSRTNYEGDAFRGQVTEPVILQGKTIIPAGASIAGRILRVSDPRRIAGTGSLRLLPESVMLPDGQSYTISASMVDTSTPKKLTVDDEGRIKARGFNGGDKAEMIAGTGAGAIAGTIIAGGKGTLFGSMIVGGATVVHWLTQRHPVDIPAGTELIMEISHPMTVNRTQLQAGE